MENEDDLVQRVFDGLMHTPALQAAMAGHIRGTLQEFIKHLHNVEDLYKQMHEDESAKWRSSRFSSRQPFNYLSARGNRRFNDSTASAYLKNDHFKASADFKD